MNMQIRTLGNRGRALAAVSVLLLLAGAAVTSQAQADETVMAYADATSQQLRQVKVALDAEINDAARRANAALTQDVRLQLDDAIQIKLRVASVTAPSRG